MAKTLTLSLALAAVLGLPLAWGAFASAQDAPKDDALDGLLKKLESTDPRPADPPAAGGAADKDNDKAKAPAKDDTGKPAADKATGAKDKDLDNFLEKLGTTDDKPSADERPRGPGGGERPPADKPEKGEKADKPEKGEKKDAPDALSGRDKITDDHLQDILGKRRKKKPQEEEGGALSEVIKEMREVEERLGKPDTGEETRKKQSQIVKQIETLIEQARSSQSQSQSKKQSRKLALGKQQPGQQNGDQPGTTGGNAPFTKPQKPTDRRSLAGGKDVWGMLPPEVRQELDNVSKEGFLLSREELIQRYYLSLTKKKVNRGEGTP